MSARTLELATARALFRDRADAGRVLARSLSKYAAQPNVVVLGLARGGVPVARQVADALGLPVGVVVAHKIGVPGIEDIALAAIAEGGQTVVAKAVASYLGVPSRIVDHLTAVERADVERRVTAYRAGLASLELRGRTVILVDDGLATGATMRAAIKSIRSRRPARLVVAVPVASRTAAHDVRTDVDELVVIVTPSRFDAVSVSYERFAPVSDDDVMTMLGRPVPHISPEVRDISDRLGAALARASISSSDSERAIVIPTSDGIIAADLGMPRVMTPAGVSHNAHKVRGLAILVHGGGSSRNSYRNRYIAGRLRLSGYSTLRVDLLTRSEQRSSDASLRLGVERVTARLVCAWEWAEREGVPGAHRTTLIGSSSGAAAALVTAARYPGRIVTVIARGGRIDLAADVLPRVTAPVLMIVGSADRETLRRNATAIERLPRGAVLMKVPRAGRRFEEPGTLGIVAEYIVNWLDRLEPQPRKRQWGA